MSARTANVNVRVEQEVKEQAEAILAQLGVSASAFINMTYRQVILHHGIPFSITIPPTVQTRDTMSDAQFDAWLARGMEQAEAGQTIPAEEVFDECSHLSV